MASWDNDPVVSAKPWEADEVIPSTADPLKRHIYTSPSFAAARGVKDVIDTGAEWLARGFDKLAGTSEGERVKAMNEAGKRDFAETTEGSIVAPIARVGGNILGTLPATSALGSAATAAGLARLGSAIGTGGMTTGAPVAGKLAGKAADMAIRATGGAVAGGASAGLVNPGDAASGATVGAALPPALAAAGAAGRAVGGAVRPFFKSGQDRIAGEAIRRFALDPAEAARNLGAAREVIPGSVPTAAMAAGDEGLAGLSRSMQSANPQFGAELASRMNAQNAARTNAIEEIAGTPGKVEAAKAARDAATGAMREGVLDAAGALPADRIIGSLDSMLKRPGNAGRISQQALSNVRDQISKFVQENGTVDARALYAIRKDINDVLGGKLQGEAGNLRHASSQLIEAKELIDRAIDQASRAVPASGGRAVAVSSSNVSRAGPAPATGPRPSWSQYLDEYRQQSIPINQMEMLTDVMKRVQTGTTDKEGNLILSAAKLNTILKNDGQDLMKKLAPEQIDLLRRLAADLNASQLAATSGKAVGSDTVQKLASTGVLQNLMGSRMGGSAPVQTLVARPVNWLYRNADQQINDRLAAAMLDPKGAARLLQDERAQSALADLFGKSVPQLSYRAAPLLPAQ